MQNLVKFLQFVRKILSRNEILTIIKGHNQGSGNSKIWIRPADEDDVINEPISKINYIIGHKN